LHGQTILCAPYLPNNRSVRRRGESARWQEARVMSIARDWIGHQFDELGVEIVRAAKLCHITLDQPHVVERIIRNDASVCGTDNPQQFTKLRGLLMLALHLQDWSFERLGPQETMEIADQVRDRIRKHLGAPPLPT
jgi:hypothetical protein